MSPDQLFSLPFEEQIGQFFFIGLPGTEVDAETRELIEEIKPGGIILFGRNVETAEQVRRLLDDSRALVPTPLLCGIDQEGGLVDRLREIFPPMPSARAIRQHGDLAGVRTLGRITGEV
ncbi:MAG TPA: glycoside hydrolase family 3 N-terminal domain-containing protein, partial [Pyrinomonadaceae bacterium]|nr:glycoside hydrolase family 3 N-terminal domain-containing protein [Pyrinomonadaceae bacterium]